MISDDDDDDLPEREDKDKDSERRRFVERLLPELIKRFVEAGVVKLTEGPENLRHFVHEMRLPKDVASYLFSQIDDTKNGLYRAVAREIRDFLEHTNLTEEISGVLTKLSFEIKTEIRFVPNDASSKVLPKPEVKSSVAIVQDGQARQVPEAPESPPRKEERPRRRGR